MKRMRQERKLAVAAVQAGITESEREAPAA